MVKEGGNLCVRKQITFLQCQECGVVYTFPHIVAIDKLYVQADCPNCGVTTALNLGNKEEDLYWYYNESVDSRYYEYD